MEQAVVFIQEVGFPIAAAIGLGWFIYKLVIRIVDGMEATVKYFYLDGNDKVELRPDNPAFESQYYPFDEVQIQGVLIALQRKY